MNRHLYHCLPVVLGLICFTACQSPTRSERLFVKERDAFLDWRAWQDTVALELIGAIWDLWHGGSAGGTWQEAYLRKMDALCQKDVESKDLILSGRMPNMRVHGTVSLKDIEAEMQGILSNIDSRFLDWREAGTGRIEVPDYYDFGLEIKPKMAKIMKRDMRLLRKWVNARNRLSRTLPASQQELFDNLTNEILHWILWQYRTRFIQDTLPRLDEEIWE